MSRRIKLRTLLLILSTVPALIFAFFFIAFNLYDQSNKIDQNIENENNLMSELIKNETRFYIETGNSTVIEPMLESLVKRPTIYEVEILSDDREVQLVKSRGDGVDTERRIKDQIFYLIDSSREDDSSVVSLVGKIKESYADKVIGSIRITSDLDSFYKTYKNIFLRIFIIAMLILALACLVAMLVSRRVKKEFYSLVNLAKKIGDGEKIYEGIESDSLEETAYLRGSIIRMNRDINHKKNKLREQMNEVINAKLESYQVRRELEASTTKRENLISFIKHEVYRPAKITNKLVARVLDADIEGYIILHPLQQEIIRRCQSLTDILTDSLTSIDIKDGDDYGDISEFEISTFLKDIVEAYQMIASERDISISSTPCFDADNIPVFGNSKEIRSFITRMISIAIYETKHENLYFLWRMIRDESNSYLRVLIYSAPEPKKQIETYMFHGRDFVYSQRHELNNSKIIEIDGLLGVQANFEVSMNEFSVRDEFKEKRKTGLRVLLVSNNEEEIEHFKSMENVILTNTGEYEKAVDLMKEQSYDLICFDETSGDRFSTLKMFFSKEVETIPVVGIVDTTNAFSGCDEVVMIKPRSFDLYQKYLKAKENNHQLLVSIKKYLKEAVSNGSRVEVNALVRQLNLNHIHTEKVVVFLNLLQGDFDINNGNGFAFTHKKMKKVVSLGKF